MRLDELVRRHTDGRCLDCFRLHGESTAVLPHDGLRLLACQPLRTGTLEEFECANCGQVMARFLALQTSPPPSDKWRYERQRSINVTSGTVDTPTECTAPAHEVLIPSNTAGDDALYDEALEAVAEEFSPFVPAQPVEIVSRA
jgi:hypothetical protein